jgi:hypothetical protein
VFDSFTTTVSMVSVMTGLAGSRLGSNWVTGASSG